MALDDYGALLRSGMAAVPDYNKQLAFQVGLQQEKLRNQAIQQEIADAQAKSARQNLFQQDLTAVGHNPTAGNISGLMMKYPEFTDKIKAAWDVKDKATRDADITQTGEIWSAASSGNWKLAAQKAHARHDADVAAGQADETDQEMLDAIDKAAEGDTTAQKTVLTTLGTHLAAATGPDHFAATFGALDKNDDKSSVVGRSIGHYETVNGERKFVVDYRDPDPAQYREIDGVDENGNPIKQIVQVGGGGPASGGAGAMSPAASGGFDNAIAFTLKHEGGYAPSDRNGQPVNMGINLAANPPEVLAKYGITDIRHITADQAKALYKERYWDPSGAASLPPAMQTPYFDTYVLNPKQAQKILAASGGDPVKFLQLRQNWLKSLEKSGKYDNAWTQRTNDLMAMVTGGSTSASGPKVVFSARQPKDTANADDIETAKYIGGQVALGQPMPPLGMGKEAAAMRRAILAEATKQWRAMGISPGEANVIAAQNKSGLAELSKIAQMKATVQTAENTASSNADQALSLLGAAGSTGSPIFNAWQQAGRRATGNSKVAAFDVAVKTLSTEYARVMSGGNSAQLSDSARHEADALIHTNMTPDQFRAAVKQMKIDMANRTAGIERERQATLQQIRTGGRAPPQADSGWKVLPNGFKVRRVN